MSNFSFLNSKWPILSSLGEIAEINLHYDPNTSLFKLRLFGEKLVQAIFAYEKLIVPHDRRQVTKLRYLIRNSIIPTKIYELLDSLREKGNLAAHEGYGSFEEADNLLRTAFQIAIWFYKTYEDDLLQQQLYKEPLKSSSPAILKQQLDELTINYKQQLRSLKGELEDLRAKEESQDALLIRRARSIIALSSMGLSIQDAEKLIVEKMKSFGWEYSKITFSQGAKPKIGVNMIIPQWPVNDRYTADYALFLGTNLIGYIDIKSQGNNLYTHLKKIIMNATKVIARGEEDYIFKNNKKIIPFVFAVDGFFKVKSEIWFTDIRDEISIPRIIRSWYTPKGLSYLLNINIELTKEKLQNEPYDYLIDSFNLRSYQIEAISEIENAILDGQSSVLVNMATGTGKTRMMVGLLYRLIKSGLFRSILFLTDRQILTREVIHAFQHARLQENYSFTDIYEIGTLERMAPENKVTVSTIQNLVYQLKESKSMLTADSFDCVVIDGLIWSNDNIFISSFINSMFFNKSEENVYSNGRYMSSFEYFDATKIVLSSYSNNNLIQIFGEPVYTYSLQDAIAHGYLLDFKLIKIFPKEVLNSTKKRKIDEKYGLSEEYIKKVLVELIEYIDIMSDEKTLIFSKSIKEAKFVVRTLQDLYSSKYTYLNKDAIAEVTSSVHDFEYKIKMFKNEKWPNIVVTVDLLARDLNVPAICNLVFLRNVKSKALLYEMLGRGNRVWNQIEKNSFRVFDAVGIFDN